MNKITASTELYGIFGYPAKHSMSPIIQNGWIQDFGFNAVYLGLEVEPHDFETALIGLEKIGLKGGNITAPLKENVAALVKYPSDEVRAIGAANTILAREGSFEAYNTDGGGLVMDLDINYDGWRDETNVVTIIGAGGAARGIINALMTRNVTEIRFVGRTTSKVLELAKIGRMLDENNTVNFATYEWDDMDKALADSDLVINATTIGLKGAGELIVNLTQTNKNAIIYDMVYMPTPTAFTSSALDQNRRAVNGLGMLVGQGVLAFKHWFDAKPDFNTGMARIKAHLDNK